MNSNITTFNYPQIIPQLDHPVYCLCTCKIVTYENSRNTFNNLHCCTVHFVVYFSNTPTNAHIFFNNLKLTLKHLKRSYMFRSYDHPQGAYTVPCYSYSLKTLSYLLLYINLVLWQHVCK